MQKRRGHTKSQACRKTQADSFCVLLSSLLGCEVQITKEVESGLLLSRTVYLSTALPNVRAAEEETGRGRRLWWTLQLDFYLHFYEFYLVS